MILTGIVVLVVILGAVWLYPFSSPEETSTTTSTGGAVTDTEDTDTEESNGETSKEKLINDCIQKCGSQSTELESEVWNRICEQKYQKGKEEIREFMEGC